MQHPLLRSARALLSTSAGCMGLDVPKTRLVIICSSPKSAWEFSQEVKILWTASDYWKFHTWTFRWAGQVGVETRLCAFSFGRKERGTCARWSPIWSRTPLPAWRRAWSKYFRSRILTVRVYFFYFSGVEYQKSVQSFKIVCSQLFIIGKRKTVVAVRLVSKPVGASAASVGQFHQCWFTIHHIGHWLIRNALRCCNKCSALCRSCPLGKDLDADQMLAAILGLGDDSFK